MRTGKVIIPSAWETDWTPLDGSIYGNISGPVWKLLSTNEESGAQTYIVNFPPNWHDDLLDWHPAAEENFVLDGVIEVGKREWEETGGYDVLQTHTYGYRPPGILHGPARIPNIGGATILHRMSGELVINRYTGTEFPHMNKTPMNDDHQSWPVPWTEAEHTADIPWQDTTTGGWAGTRHKWVWRHKTNGGGVIMFDLPAGWSGTGSPARGSLEEFVIEGALTAGADSFGKWGYAHREPGDPAGTYSTETGAQLVCWWDEANELD